MTSKNLMARFIGFGQHSLWHGYGFHNLVFSFETPLDFSEKEVYDRGDIKITLQYGKKKNRVTIRITCTKRSKQKPKPTKFEVIPSFIIPFVITEMKGLLSQKLSKIPNDDKINVRCFELHEGFWSLRLEGIDNLTLEDFINFVFHVVQSSKPPREAFEY